MWRDVLRQDLQWLSSKSPLAARLVGLQGLLQLLGFVAALICVRAMSKAEYALFTIMATLTAALSVLADSGTGAGLQALAGKVWPDTAKLGELVASAQGLRRRLLSVVTLVLAPPFLWLLARNGAPWPYATLLIALAVAAVWHSTASVALTVPVRLYSRYEVVQRAEIRGALARLLLMAGAAVLWLNAMLASLATLLGAVLHRQRLAAEARSLIEMPREHEAKSAFDGELSAYLRPLAAPTLFLVFQGQIAVWLVGVLGQTHSVADLGAVGRFSALFAVLGSVLSQNSGAVFARCRTPRELGVQLRRVMSMAALTLMPPLLLLLLAPRVVLLVLGSQYLHLSSELRLVALVSVASRLTGILWALDSARGWVAYAWLLIPLSLASQAAALLAVSPSTVLGVLYLSLAHALATLCVYVVLAVRGWARWATADGH